MIRMSHTKLDNFTIFFLYRAFNYIYMQVCIKTLQNQELQDTLLQTHLNYGAVSLENI